MKPQDFFIGAIRASAHYKRAWVLRAFTVTQENPNFKTEGLPEWSIVRSIAGVMFVNASGQLEQIEGVSPTLPIIQANTVLVVPAGFFIHWPEGGVTTAGNLLYHAICLWTTVGSKFGYINTRVSQADIERRFAESMIDDPEDGKKDPTQIYVSDWLKYGQAMKYLEEFSQVFVWSLTAASVVPSKVVLQRKKELLEKHANELDNPVIQAKIFKELEDLDAEQFKNDPGKAFITTRKHKLARRKLTIIFGAERGLDASEKPKLIPQSLHDGLKPDDMVEVMNVSRAGSFDRGAETMLGGVEAKWGDRIMSAAKMVPEDCGTTLGYSYTVKPSNVKNTTGRYLMDVRGLTLIETTEQARALIGKRITVRSPARCSSGPSSQWCQYCLGAKLAANDKSLGLAVSAYGSGFLNLFLKKMHSKALIAVRMRVRELMS